MYTIHFLKKCPVERYFFASKKARGCLTRMLDDFREAVERYNDAIAEGLDDYEALWDPNHIIINKMIVWNAPHVDEVARCIIRTVDPISGTETERWEVAIREQ